MKKYFQNIHYLRKTPSPFLKGVLTIAEFCYKKVINFKNYLYKKNYLKEKKANAYTICIGNLTTGGVGKTPIVIEYANELSKKNKTAIISRGYGAKISNKNPLVIKDENSLKFKDGRLCSDEAYQLAKKTNDNVVVITCKDRLKAAKLATDKYKIQIIILDDGFSNRKIKKDKTIVVIDSKMRFGNNHLLPFGPLREPVEQIKRADEIIIVNKGDNNINDALMWAKSFNKPTKLCQMTPDKIYNMQTKAIVTKPNKAIAFCAIGQCGQFFDFAKQYYELVDTVEFSDHYKYNQKDIQKLIELAKSHNVNTFITTQKDEAKLKELTKGISRYSFNVMELKNTIEDV